MSAEDESTPLVASEVQEAGNSSGVIENPWEGLRQFTPARIALGRSGHSLPTQQMLAFQLAHAQARDAVYADYNPALLVQQLHQEGLEAFQVTSRASDRFVFLRQPDLGRRLVAASLEQIAQYTRSKGTGYEAVFVLGDGLSAEAAHLHAIPVLKLVTAALGQAGWRIGPVVVASESRVALGDEIGEVLGAEQVAIFIGERPGLSAAQSLGIYLTYKPFVGRLESDRNCISNIHQQGLSYQLAAQTLVYLMQQSRRLKYGGVRLKDERG